VMFLAMDATWQWRQNVADRWFYRFWGQAVRFVAKPPGGLDKPTLEASPARLAPGDEASLILHTRQEADSLEVTVAPLLANTAAPPTVRLTRDPSVPGPRFRYTGKIRLTTPDRYRFEYTQNDANVAAEVLVVEGNEEFRRMEVDRAALEVLAQRSGGKVLEAWELAKLPALLKGQPQTRHLTKQQDLWDTWLTIVLVAGLYCLDVGIRRWCGLS
jgi:hypothetical protein